MAEYAGEYGHPYPRVDKYGRPVPPVDQYGNPIPREPSTGLSGGTTAPYGGTGDVPVGEYGAGAAYPHEGVRSGATPPGGAAMYPGPGGGVGHDETALAYEGMGGAQVQPIREEHTTTLGEKLTGSGSGGSSSSSSSEDDGQGARRRKKKSIKDKIKEKLPGSHRREEQKQQGAHAPPAAGGGGTTHEKKGVIDKIKEKLPGHH